jgi:tetratricopeptide (TPR) repeat protein
MTKTFSRVTLFAASVLAASVVFSPAFAAGSGSSGGDTKPAATEPALGPKPTAAKLGCKTGQVVVKGKKASKPAWVCANKKAELLSDEDLYLQGVALAKDGHYDWALELLTSISDQNDPRVLNYIGYSHRKAGRIETGVAFYRKALRINPDFVLAREYLGEGYVAAGRIDLAQVELSEIGKRCGQTCSEYKALADVIATAVN